MALSATGAGVNVRGPYQRRSKYAAVPVVVSGFRFASKAEARRYSELLLLGMAGEIRNLELQPRFPLLVDGTPVAFYVGDFRYDEFVSGGWLGLPSDPKRYRLGNWRDVVEDCKGVLTPVYRLKKRIFEAQYGIQIRETR